MVEPVSTRITLRPALPQDSKRLWEWRNEQATREASFNTKYIPFEEHERWFACKLTDPYTPIFIAINSNGREVGYVRFEIVGEEAEISIGIDKVERGVGCGVAAIKSGLDQLMTTKHLERIVAYIRRANTSSMAVFERAGFTLQGYRQIAGVEACEMVYEGQVSDCSSMMK